MALQEYKSLFKDGQRIGGIFNGENLVWPATVPTGPDYSEPMYLENTTDTDAIITLKRNGSTAPVISNVEYSSDRITWNNTGEITTTAFPITVAANSKMYFRCSTTAWGSVPSQGHWNSFINSTNSDIFKLGGNLLSLYYGSAFTGLETTYPDTSNANARNLFQLRSLYDASKLLIPKTLAQYCLQRSFENCSRLRVAPDLLCVDLPYGCYNQTFRGCSSLAYVKCIAQTNIDGSRIENWLYAVSATGTFVKAAGVTWPSGASGIPSNWTVQEA